MIAFCSDFFMDHSKIHGKILLPKKIKLGLGLGAKTDVRDSEKNKWNACCVNWIILLPIFNCAIFSIFFVKFSCHCIVKQRLYSSKIILQNMSWMEWVNCFILHHFNYASTLSCSFLSLRMSNKQKLPFKTYLACSVKN